MYRSVFRPGLFLGQVAVVTGGGSGIGRCTAHELASLGAAVALVGRNADKLAAVRTEIVEAGGTAHAYVCNIRDEAAVQATIAQILGEHGRIDALVNNAGGQFPSPLKDISVKGWEAVVQTNLTGGFLMARECLNQAMQQRGGAIVNIVADMWGGMPNMGHSGAARAGMINFTETAAFEWAQYGVRVNAVAPGYVASSGMDAYPPWMAETIRSNAPRTGLTMSYDLAILRQEENHYLTLPIERVKRFPEDMQRLLGWSCSTTYAGFVERNGVMTDPQALLQQDDFVEVGHFN